MADSSSPWLRGRTLSRLRFAISGTRFGPGMTCRFCACLNTELNDTNVTAKTVQCAARPVILAFMGFISFHPTDRVWQPEDFDVCDCARRATVTESEGSDSDHGCVARRPPVMKPKFYGIARPTGNDVKATR